MLNKKSIADAEIKEKEKKVVEKTKVTPKKEVNYLDKALKIANSPIGKTIVRGVLGSIFGSNKRR